MENLGLFSVLIPLFIIIMAIITKDVVVSLLSGIFLGELVIHGFNPFTAFIALLDGFIGLFAEGWITKTILFALLVGSIIKLLTRSGAVRGFVSYLSQKQQSLDSPRGALLLAYFLGVIIFIESSITALVAGTVARPLCDKHGVSREKLAYVCDSTSAPVCSLIPFNAWGALLLGLIVTGINDKVIEGEGISLLIESILYNFYSLITIFMVLAVILFNINFGPMAKAKAVKFEEVAEKEQGSFAGTVSDTKEISRKIITKISECSQNTSKNTPDYLDLDYRFDEDNLYEFFEEIKRTRTSQNISKNNFQLILSAHFFEGTPSFPSLKNRTQLMQNRGADIVKIAAMPQEEKDVLTIFRLSENFKRKEIPYIAISMGSIGKISRVLTVLWKGEMMFASLSKNNASASGQMTVTELSSLLSAFTA